MILPRDWSGPGSRLPAARARSRMNAASRISSCSPIRSAIGSKNFPAPAPPGRPSHRGVPFLRDVLGFRLSDYMVRPFNAYFFHANPRHHSIAFIETGRSATHHLMVELYSLDDVGQCYDLALRDEGRIGVTLGRHINDEVTSFYSNSPSGFMVEYGWGGGGVDGAGWRTEACTYEPSMWGHDRLWLPPEKRDEARRIR